MSHSERKKQRPAAGSLKAVQEAFANVDMKVELPAGYKFKNKQEERVWDVLAAARVPSDWREHDLLTLYKIMKLEIELKVQQAHFEKEGALLEGARGGPIENPRCRILDVMERRQLALIRSLSMNVTGSDTRVMKRQAATAQNTKAIAQSNAADDFSHLLATPMN